MFKKNEKSFIFYFFQRRNVKIIIIFLNGKRLIDFEIFYQ